jgi:hypothetical protein
VSGLGKDELWDAEDEILDILKKDEAPPDISVPKYSQEKSKTRLEVRTGGIPLVSALGFPLSVGLGSILGLFLLLKATSWSIIPLAAFGFLSTFIPGLLSGIGDRFFTERVISPTGLAVATGLILGVLGFVLLYTIPLSSFPLSFQEEIYPFGSVTSMSMMGLGMPASTLLRAVSSTIVATFGFGIFFGVLFSHLISKKEV